MKVLITGAKGLLASSLIQELVPKYLEVGKSKWI